MNRKELAVLWARSSRGGRPLVPTSPRSCKIDEARVIKEGNMHTIRSYLAQRRSDLVILVCFNLVVASGLGVATLRPTRVR